MIVVYSVVVRAEGIVRVKDRVGWLYRNYPECVQNDAALILRYTSLWGQDASCECITRNGRFWRSPHKECVYGSFCVIRSQHCFSRKADAEDSCSMQEKAYKEVF